MRTPSGGDGAMCQGEKKMRSAKPSPQVETDPATLAMVVAVTAMILALSAAFTRAAEPVRLNPLRTSLQDKSIPEVNPLTRRVDFFKMLKRTKPTHRPSLVIQPVSFQVDPQADSEPQSLNNLPALPPIEEPAAEQETVKPLERTEDFPRKPIGQITTDITPPVGDAPADYAAPAFEQYRDNDYYQRPARSWQTTPFQWEASALCHRPLYFEEVNLERYGYSVGLIQPAVSAAHFFGSVVALPYKSCVEPSHQCIYTLGHYRPGSCVPYRYHYPRLSVDAGLWQAGVITGLIFLIP